MVIIIRNVFLDLFNDVSPFIFYGIFHNQTIKGQKRGLQKKKKERPFMTSNIVTRQTWDTFAGFMVLQFSTDRN